MRDFVRRDFTLPIERYDAETRVVTGIISSSALDAFGDQIDQDGIQLRGSVPLLWSHDHRTPIGRAVSIARDGDKTRASFELSKTDPAATRIHNLAREGIVTGLSVGLVPKKWSGNRLTESELVEVSLVSVPANPDAAITAVRSAPQNPESITMENGIARVASPRVAAPSIVNRNVERWSFARAIAMITEDPDGPDVGFERECHAEMIKRGAVPKHGGFMIPMRGLLERAIGAVPPSDPAVPLTQTEYMSQLFGLDSDAITPVTVMGRLGAQVVVASQGTVHIPRQSVGLGAMQWIARDGTATEGTDATFRGIDLTPCTGVALHMVKRSARLYTVPGVEDLYRQQMIEKIAAGVDTATLYGSGVAPIPAGLITQATLQKPTLAALDYPSLASMAAAILTLPAPEANRKWLMNGALQLALLSTHKFGATAKTDETIIEEGVDTLLGVPFLTGPQVPVNASTGATDIWLGDWAMVIQCWFNSAAIEILPNPYESVAYKSGAIWLESFVDFNTTCLDAKRLAVSQGVVSPIKPASLEAESKPAVAAKHGGK